ncbi:MAG: hypothetical protein R3212_00385 [Xanthomonadales bacterium]|nr:hypothetical protein [Xanthomonadales bacterium]
MYDLIEGQCHCGRLAFQLETRIGPERIRARACACRFCRAHAARTWSDPEGKAIIKVNDAGALQRYRFAQKTADYFICRVCGAYLGAVLHEGEKAWSTLNLRLSELDVPEDAVDYDAEDTIAKVDRRKRKWTPTVVC